MSVLKTYSLESLAEFPNRSEKLAIFERDPVKGADEFFQKIMINKFKPRGWIERTYEKTFDKCGWNRDVGRCRSCWRQDQQDRDLWQKGIQSYHYGDREDKGISKEKLGRSKGSME